MTTTGDKVWEWRVWDHLDPATHPITSPADSRADWTPATDFDLETETAVLFFRTSLVAPHRAIRGRFLGFAAKPVAIVASIKSGLVC